MQSLRNILAIARRELESYFVSPIAYVVTAAFLFISGYFFTFILFYTRQATLRYLFSNLSVIALFVAPILTMRLISEEKRSGTIELVLTSPVRDWEFVLGKFLASLALFTLMLALTLYYPLLLEIFGNPDRGAMLAGYIGLWLYGAALLSVGVLASSLTRNQIIAAVLGFGLVLILWVCDAAGDFTGAPLSHFFRYLSLSAHYFDFPKGIVDTRDVVYYLSLTAAGLFLSTLSLSSRRWS